MLLLVYSVIGLVNSMQYINKYSLSAGAVALVAGAFVLGGNSQAQEGAANLVFLENAQEIVWEKPKNDAEWAEDVKAEGLDARSNAVITEMIELHTAQLREYEKTNKEVFECSECIKYRLQDSGRVTGAKDSPEAQAQIDALYAEKLEMYTYTTEKLKQSVERMQNEMRLRKTEYVIPDKDEKGAKTKDEDLQKVPPERIRKIYD